MGETLPKQSSIKRKKSKRSEIGDSAEETNSALPDCHQESTMYH